MVLDVDGDHLGGAPLLQLEGEIPVERPNIEAALAPDVGPRQLIDNGPKVKPSGGGHTGRDVDGVIPERVFVHSLLQLVAFQGSLHALGGGSDLSGFTG